jgi:hexosaminidase
MNRIIIIISLIMTMITTTTSAAVKASYDIVPLPASVSMQKGTPFMLSSATRIIYVGSDEAMKRNAKFLADYLAQTTGIKLSTNAASGKAQKNTITLCTDSKMGEEAYRISVDKKGIVITGGSAKGVFYGIQTLRKSVPVGKTDNIELSAVRIADQPRFGYRGMMLDCSRHFFTVDFIKKYLDLMAMHNMNVFHWHLTDDQGWRIEIKKYPRLTSIGSKRSGTIVGFNSMVDDQREYSGFYTQDQAREIVEYARQRYITVIPEIDMPFLSTLMR